MLVDYSGGTGILAERLLGVRPDVRILIVDASAAFLSAAFEKLGGDARVGFRLLAPKGERLARLDEVAGEIAGQVDALVSTNAVHLYDDLGGTFASWQRVLREGALVFVQSAEIKNPAARPDERLITDVLASMRHAARIAYFKKPRIVEFLPALPRNANGKVLRRDLRARLLEAT